MGLRRSALALAVLLCGTTWAATPETARAVYEKYMDFRSLVKSCDLPTHWDADGTGLSAGNAPTQASAAAEDPVADAFGISRRARFTPRPFKHQMFLAGEIEDYEVMSPDQEWLASL